MYNFVLPYLSYDSKDILLALETLAVRRVDRIAINRVTHLSTTIAQPCCEMVFINSTVIEIRKVIGSDRFDNGRNNLNPRSALTSSHCYTAFYGLPRLGVTW